MKTIRSFVLEGQMSVFDENGNEIKGRKASGG